MSDAPGGKSRPVGFLLLVLGLGVRMDSSWDLLSSLLIGAGLVTATIGLWALARPGMRGSFVPRRAGE